jgi:hypothetical protein
VTDHHDHGKPAPESTRRRQKTARPSLIALLLAAVRGKSAKKY